MVQTHIAHVPASVEFEEQFAQTNGLLDALDACAIVAITDEKGRILYANQQFQRLSGYSMSELRGSDHRLLNSGHHPKSFWKEMYRAVHAGQTWRAEVKNRAKDGREYWVDTTIRAIFNEHGRVTRMVAIRIDITERKQIEQQLRESRERYMLAMRGTNDGIWDWDLIAGTVYYSPRWKAILGLPDALKDESPDLWLGRVHSDDLPQLRADIELCMSGTHPHLCNDHRVLCDDGTYLWVQVRAMCVQDETGQAVRMVGSLADRHELKAVMDELNRAASLDRLTNLPNRRLLTARLEEVIKRASCFESYRFAVLFLDFDRFKIVNDNLGHDVGDMLLKKIADRLRKSLRLTDALCYETCGNTVARLGGDEFVVILDDLKSPHDAMAVAERLLTVLDRPYDLEGHVLRSTASIGIVTSDVGATCPAQVLRDADAAMYEAKRTGKNRAVMFDTSMREKFANRLKLEEDMRGAVERGEFYLVYQPIVSLETGRVTGMEALLRWQHPTLGLVSPADFISIAEDSGLIIPIGEWVIRQACADFLSWHENLSIAPPMVSVNLSPIQFALSDLPARIESLLRETGIEPSQLQLEVTESQVIRDPDASASLLKSIKQLGVKLAMDDFGTGHSSLAYLHQFPFDVLKIDRSFIANLDRGRDIVALVHAVCTLAENLGMKIVAEGIEHADQIAVLQSLGCQDGQGFYFSKAVPYTEAIHSLQYEVETRDRTRP